MVRLLRESWIPLLPVAVAALLLLDSPSARAECVWQPPDGDKVGAAIEKWFGGTGHPGPTPKWALSARNGTVALKLGAAGATAMLEITLAPDCSRSVTTRWQTGSKAWFSDTDASRLAAELGLVSQKVEQREEGARQLRLPVISGQDPLRWHSVAFALLALCSVCLAFARRRDGPAPLIVDTVLLAGLMLLAAWPLFPVPFTTDAQILRVAFAARDVFGDWNHPFFSYLLNRPAALLSSDPVVLRISMFAWALLEAFLFSLAARRQGGRPAAVLTGVWMAASVRLTMGMVDLSDWNLAGVFLALMLLWLIGERRRGKAWQWIPIPALLVIGGCFTSYMMVVPSAVLAGILVVERVRTKVHPFQAVSTVLAVVACGAVVLDVFLRGSASTDNTFTHDLPGMLRGLLLVEPPFGLSILMPFLVVGGLFLTSFRRSGAPWYFVLATEVVSVVALAVALTFSAVNGAYYFSLCKGLAFIPAALLVQQGISGALDYVGRFVTRPAWIHAAVAPVLLAVLVILSTFRVETSPRATETGGIDHMADFVEMSGRGDRRVFSNDINATTLMLYSEVLSGRQDIGVILAPRGDTWVHRTVARFGVDAVDCGRLPDSFLVLWRNMGGSGTDERCRPMQGHGCTELFLEQGDKPCSDSRRAFCYYDCRGGVESVASDGTR